jgi:hypothetical protein
MELGGPQVLECYNLMATKNKPKIEVGPTDLTTFTKQQPLQRLDLARLM